MSELFMECEEEELEPWQKQVPEVNLIDDADDDDDDNDDDEPIFIGELVKNPKIFKPSPPVRNDVSRPETQPQPLRGVPIMLSSSVPGKGAIIASPSLSTVTPHPVIVNSQGFIVQPQQLRNANLIATLGKQYPPGTSFTIVPAGQQPLLPLMPQARVMPGVVHRPQVKLNNNVVTLSNVQNPAVYSSSIPHASSNQLPNTPIKIFSLPVEGKTEVKGDQSSLKRGLLPQQNEVKAKKVKLEPGQQKKVVDAQNVRKCPKCKEEFHQQNLLKSHMMSCAGDPVESVSPSTPNKSLPATTKHILLVGDFYYGRVEGDWQTQRPEHKTNTTFKCQSCHKILKNNIRFMNHMKHHLELEKQSSESWESHTTCQHCYRQYLTPFQLQCHVERAHSPLASSTNCKICELAFETEQVLLEHMKDTHKPGEMPYACQVCNFRSSFFMEVEAHFKVAHDNTKDLLCPFCLKVLRSGYAYMQHYMRHQRKSIHRCGKCRLNFLTYKERVDHKINFHRTFKKPKALDGLPPGTKVTIRASLTGNISSSNPSPTGLAPEENSSKPAKYKRLQIFGKSKNYQPKKEQGLRVSKKNMALKNTRIGGGPHTCIECSTEVNDFFSHYPMVSNCGACKYQTSCKVSISNHMIRYHSTISKDRFKKMGSQRASNSSVNGLSCHNCDYVAGASEGDKMTKHLTENPHHTCRVIRPKVAAPASDLMLTDLQPPRIIYVFTNTTTTAGKPKEGDLKRNGASVSLQEQASVQLAAVTVDKENEASIGKEAGADGDKKARADGDKEAGADGGKEAGAAGSKEAGADRCKDAGADRCKEAGADRCKEAGAAGSKDAGADRDKKAGADRCKAGAAGGEEGGPYRGEEAGHKDAREDEGNEAGDTASKDTGVDARSEGAEGKQAGADWSKEAGNKEAGEDQCKEVRAAGAKEAGEDVGKEAKEVSTAISADASVPPLGTLEGSPVLEDCLGSTVGIDQVRKLVSSLQEDLISSAQKAQTEVKSLSNQGTPVASPNVAHDEPE